MRATLGVKIFLSSAFLAIASTLALPAVAVMAGAANGSPSDTPALRVDANTTVSPWAGVGSLQVNGSAYSAAAIHTRHVLTAAHVVKGANPANVIFNINYGGDLTYRIPAIAIFPHPQYVSFNNPNLQHDIAVVELASDIPAGVPIYARYVGNPPQYSTLTIVGYGASGDGSIGVSVNGNAAVKRVGKNNADAFSIDVDGSGRAALYQFDFDGPTNATNFLGGLTLGNNVETTFAGGDSGSPSFIYNAGTWQLVGVNTFVGSFPGGPTVGSTFGTMAGGNLVWVYENWIDRILSRPINDTFARAAVITGLVQQLATNNTNASKESGEPNHGGVAGGASLWWRWVAPETGAVALDTRGSTIDTLLAVYTGGAVAGLTPVASDDNAGGNGASALTFTAQAGVEYRIAVDAVNAQNGDIVLNLVSDSVAGADIPMLPGWGLWLLAGVFASTLALPRRA